MTGTSSKRASRALAILAKAAVGFRSIIGGRLLALEPGPGTIHSASGGFLSGPDALAVRIRPKIPQGRYLVILQPGVSGQVAAAAAGMQRAIGLDAQATLLSAKRGQWRGVITVPSDSLRIWLVIGLRGRTQPVRPKVRLIPLPDALWKVLSSKVESGLSASQAAHVGGYEAWQFARRLESLASPVLPPQGSPGIEVLVCGTPETPEAAKATAVSLLGQSAAPQRVTAGSAFSTMLDPWLHAALARRTSFITSDEPLQPRTWVAAIRAGDSLSPYAIAEYEIAAARHPGAQLIYADNDLIDEDGLPHSPFFKPSFSPLFLLSRDFLSRSASIAPQLAGSALRDAQVDPLALAGLVPDASVIHIPRVLHHLAGDEHPAPALPGCELLDRAPAYAERFFGAKRPTGSRASVLIPTAARPEIVRRCIESILSLTDHPDFEVLLDVNGPRAAELAELAEEMSAKGPVRMVASSAGRYPGFNFAGLVNGLAAQAAGKHLVLLNDDTEVISPAWLKDLCCYLDHPVIGAVGAKLLYPGAARVQHAGMVLGVAGVAAHSFVGSDAREAGYQGYLIYPREVSALTGAALAIRSELFDRLGGMDQANLAVSYNDVDLCLRAQEAGYVNVFAPEALLIHHETITRQPPTEGEALEREQAEVAYLQKRWSPQVLEADPFYNPNLTLTFEHLFTVDDHPRPREARAGGPRPFYAAEGR